MIENDVSKVFSLYAHFSHSACTIALIRAMEGWLCWSMEINLVRSLESMPKRWRHLVNVRSLMASAHLACEIGPRNCLVQHLIFPWVASQSAGHNDLNQATIPLEVLGPHS